MRRFDGYLDKMNSVMLGKSLMWLRVRDTTTEINILSFFGHLV